MTNEIELIMKKKKQAIVVLLGLVVVGVAFILIFSSSLSHRLALFQRQLLGDSSGYRPFQETEKKQKPEFTFSFVKDTSEDAVTNQTQRYLVQAVGKPQSLSAVKMRIVVTYDVLPSFTPKKLNVVALTKEAGWNVIVNDVRLEKEQRQVIYELSAIHVSENGYIPQDVFTIGAIDVILPQKKSAKLEFDTEKVALVYKTGNVAVLEYKEEMLVAK